MKPLIALAIIILTAPCAWAESRSAAMNVSVSVVPRAVLAVDQPPAIAITNHDIRRGYVDIPDAIVVRVRTNDRRGYLLHASKIDPSFERVELSMPGARMSVAETAWSRRAYAGETDVMHIRARLHLGTESQPGIRPLPVRFDATTLD